MNNYKPLSLKESLNLADKVNEWEYSKSRIENKDEKKFDIPLFSTLITKTYAGKLDELVIRISELESRQRHYHKTVFGYSLWKGHPPDYIFDYIIEIKYNDTVLNNPKKMIAQSLVEMYNKIESKYKHSKKDSRITSSDFKKGILKSRNTLTEKVKQ